MEDTSVLTRFYLTNDQHVEVPFDFILAREALDAVPDVTIFDDPREVLTIPNAAAFEDQSSRQIKVLRDTFLIAPSVYF